jgi:hypothetical protein
LVKSAQWWIPLLARHVLKRTIWTGRRSRHATREMRDIRESLLILHCDNNISLTLITLVKLTICTMSCYMLRCIWSESLFCVVTKKLNSGRVAQCRC